ncbi:MAG: tRNA pseudouridine(55) synthase TruB [Bacilli bacterium]
MVDGLLLINKEKGWTSRDVCNKVQHIFHTKKVGHSGTLDPFAEGLLLVLINKGTKIIPFLEHDNKVYVAKMTFHYETDTLDNTGTIINKTEHQIPNIDDIKKIINEKFIGDIEQVPPMYSAIHYNGKRLYDLARKGQQVDIKPRKINIKKFDIIDYENGILTFLVNVSNGTYIRSIARDLAKEFSCFGSLVELKRISIGSFDIKNAKKIDEINENDIISINDSLIDFPKYYIKDEKYIMDGKPLHLDYNVYGEYVYVCSLTNCPLAIYQHDKDNIYRSKRGLF